MKTSGWTGADDESFDETAATLAGISLKWERERAAKNALRRDNLLTPEEGLAKEYAA